MLPLPSQPLDTYHCWKFILTKVEKVLGTPEIFPININAADPSMDTEALVWRYVTNYTFDTNLQKSRLHHLGIMEPQCNAIKKTLLNQRKYNIIIELISYVSVG